MNRVAVIEAQPHPDFAAGTVEGATPSPKMELKPLTGERQSDALFGEYDKANQEKVRSAFRLPPIFLGRADDYTRATAEASLDTAESQVFAPERDKFDTVMNLRILTDADGKPPALWHFRSNPARITNPENIVETLDKLELSGAMTPNQAISLANELFGKARKHIKEAWGDLPFSLILEMVKAGKIDAEKMFAGLAGMTVEPPAPVVLDPTTGKALPAPTAPAKPKATAPLAKKKAVVPAKKAPVAVPAK